MKRPNKNKGETMALPSNMHQAINNLLYYIATVKQALRHKEALEQKGLATQ